MNDADRESLETRVLVLVPTVEDEELTRAILAQAGITCVGCPDQVRVCEQLTAGAGAVLIAEEAVHGGDGCLAEWLGRQPPWSDLPVLILARTGADSVAVARAMEELGNVTVVERPARVAALVSVVRTALRARQRQYQLRDHLVERERLSEERDRATATVVTTLESITDGFTRFDRDWRVVYVNDEAERMNQRPRAETLGKTVWELFPALVGTKLEAEYRRCVADQVTVEFDYHYPPWDRWFTLKCHPTEDGLAVSLRDITAHKRTADGLQQIAARFHAAIEAVSDIVWTNDAEGRMAGEQVGWGDFTGQDRESYQGYGWSNAIHPDDAQPTIDAWNEAVAGKKNLRVRTPGSPQRRPMATV